MSLWLLMFSIAIEKGFSAWDNQASNNRFFAFFFENCLFEKGIQHQEAYRFGVIITV